MNFFNFQWPLAIVTVLASVAFVSGQTSTETKDGQVSPSTETSIAWNQWRGPNRDGKIESGLLPEALDDSVLKKSWSLPLGPSYSGPLVVGDRVFVTETKNKRSEVVTAIDLKTGQAIWSKEWDGAMQVPFFAAANGSWIRATPAYDDGKLYIAGIRDVLVCLDAADGSEIWRLDFPKKMGTNLPSFGFVCSPLVDGAHVYVQAGAAFNKIDKQTGEIVWQSLQDGGGMNGSAFSSPVIATVAGKRQAIVLTRPRLCGVDLDTGEQLWSKDIPSFRGMNILTPTIVGNGIFTSTYGGTSQLIDIREENEVFSTAEKWNTQIQGYMSSPVVIDGHAYTHLRNRRFSCIDLTTGAEKWRSQPVGQYVSMVASGDKILALSQTGQLMLIQATPSEFKIISERKVGSDSWAHVAVSGNRIAIRNLHDITVYQW